MRNEKRKMKEAAPDGKQADVAAERSSANGKSKAYPSTSLRTGALRLHNGKAGKLGK